MNFVFLSINLLQFLFKCWLRRGLLLLNYFWHLLYEESLINSSLSTLRKTLSLFLLENVFFFVNSCMSYDLRKHNIPFWFGKRVGVVMIVKVNSSYWKATGFVDSHYTHRIWATPAPFHYFYFNWTIIIRVQSSDMLMNIFLPCWIHFLIE